MSETTAKRKKKRRYTWVIEKERPSLGVLYDATPILNALPPIGSVVIIYERLIINPSNYWGLVHMSGTSYTEYVYCDNYVDTWGNALELEVLHYTHGIKSPLDAKNCMVCRCVKDHANVLPLRYVRTLHIACGYLKAEIVR